MALQTLEELLSRSAALFQHEQTLENNRDIDSASASLLSSTATSPQRRCEERTDDQHMCSYEIRETIGGESVVIGEGRGFPGQSERGRNTSSHGSGASRKAVH